MQARSITYPDLLCRGSLTLTAKDGSISIDGRSIKLGTTELRALHYLMVNDDRLVGWSELSKYLWDDEGAVATTKIAISRLQEKVGKSRLRRVAALGVLLASREGSGP